MALRDQSERRNMTPEIVLVLSVLAVTMFLFLTELLRVDVIAILIMISLAWLGLVDARDAFAGLSSNAVISIIAVMILGYGVDRSGIMNQLTKPILRLAGRSESRLIGLVSSVVGLISAFMQNVGAAALFLPAMLRMSKRTGIPASRLLMPMGFAAILGGTLSMVGSSPLIILNDLMRAGGQERFGLFSVTPIGLALLAAGIGCFVLFGKHILPSRAGESSTASRQQELIASWQLPVTIHELVIPPDSPIIGKTRDDIHLEREYRLNLVALTDEDEVLHAPWRHAHFAARQVMAILGEHREIERFASAYGLELRSSVERFEDLQNPATAGFAEIIVSPRSSVAGKTLRDIALRKNYEVEPLILLSGGKEERGDFADSTLGTGDAIIVHGRWDRIKALGSSGDFVLVTAVEIEEIDESKGLLAAGCFLGAIALALGGAQLSVALMTGALAMVLLRVIKIDDAYKAVDWRTVFLLAGLIPLGIAMEKTGAASYVAGQMMEMLSDSHTIILLLAIAALTTLFSLFMSNVAATVLLVPLVISVAEIAGLDPRALSLLVGVSASNSFLVPTHQVNALLMGPGGYRNADYFKAGGLMTILFILIAVGFLYLFYL
jgi:di/tricarboxylate transporter